MSEADLKLHIIRLIDSQQGEILQEIYSLIVSKLYEEKQETDSLSALEMGYKNMAEDTEREAEAYEWIEHTFDSKEI
ncbi:MAG: hypothetical protein JJT94_11755 [Bernardetiaceae bacterium]|nr:hypothetical protein [Bernardetiaceae bacterium]